MTSWKTSTGRLYRARTPASRSWAIAAWTLGLGTTVGMGGVPWSRDWLALWLLLLVAAVTVGRPVAEWSRAARDWVPLLAILLTYDLIRGQADELGMPVHLAEPLAAERWLFGGTVPTVELQERFLVPGAPGLHDVAAWAIYTSHFFVIPILLASLWLVRSFLFGMLARRVVAVTLIAFIGYVLYPAAPPWMAASVGELPDLTRHVWSMWHQVGLSPAATIWQGGSHYANDVAAIPSLHAAYPATLVLLWWARSRWPTRTALGIYAVAMAVVLVYTAEHYVIDILLGWMAAMAAHAGCRGWERGRKPAVEWKGSGLAAESGNE